MKILVLKNEIFDLSQYGNFFVKMDYKGQYVLYANSSNKHDIIFESNEYVECLDVLDRIKQFLIDDNLKCQYIRDWLEQYNNISPGNVI